MRGCWDGAGAARLVIRPAEEGDYPAVRDFYYALTDEMADAPYRPGWERDVYTAQAFLTSSIRQRELYLGYLDGALAACMVAKQAYNEGYRSVAWGVEAADRELLVIHALGVRRAFAGHGLAKEMARYALQMARSQGMKTVRLDVLGGNLPAERAYAAVGFHPVDTLKMYYDDTGWTDYQVFEYLL